MTGDIPEIKDGSIWHDDGAYEEPVIIVNEGNGIFICNFCSLNDFQDIPIKGVMALKTHADLHWEAGDVIPDKTQDVIDDLIEEYIESGQLDS
jgi:hypothetical protein